MLDQTVEFFEKAKPNPTDKDISVQLGVHFEEVREMIIELIPTNPHAKTLLDRAESSLYNLAEHLKLTEGQISIDNPIEYLDSLCDQIVTAVGAAHMCSYDILGAMDEVNRSNLSKFDKDGNPVFDPNRKIVKGPNYFKPDLSTFV